MRQYGSKREVYRDFDLAIKLITDDTASSEYYARIQDSLAWDDRTKVDRLVQAVAALPPGGASSAGFVVEVPAYGDSHDLLGYQFVLLEHETGPEWFVKLATDPAVTSSAIALLLFLRNKAFDALYTQVKQTMLARLGPHLRHRWQEIKGGARVSAVELRTEDRGVCRIRFSAFELEQLECLLVGMAAARNDRLIDFNQTCFRGELVEAEDDD